MLAFVGELRRRNVFRAGTLYAAAAWLVVQVATQVLPVFDAPNWVQRLIVVAAVIGLPFVLAFAWYYELTPEGLKLESEVEREHSIRHLTGKRLDRAIIAVLCVVVVVLLANTFVLHRDADAISGKSVAVLPLLDESAGGSDRYFSDGLSEELISDLTQINGLKVIGRNSSFQFRGDTSDSRSIGDRLGVATLLEGTVRRDGERVRIVIGLVNAADGRSLWSQTYDRDFKDIFAVQSDISRSVASAMQIELSGAADGSDGQPPGGNLQAYNAYLQGKFYGERGTQADERRAIAELERAVRIDPRYAQAYAELSMTWTSMTSVFLGGAEMRQGYQRSREAADAALRLAPNLAAAHVARGSLLYASDFDWAGAEAEYRRALQLTPNDGEAKYRLGTLLATLGQPAPAIDLTRQALVTDPLHANWYSSLASYLAALGRLDEAEQAIGKAIELQPSSTYYHAALAFVNIQRGEAEAALRAARDEPAGPWRDIAMAMARQIGGDSAAANEALRIVVDQHAGDGAYQIAEIYGVRKQPDQVFQWLDRAHANGDPGVSNVLLDPFLTAYKDDPRFAAFCRKVGLPAPAPRAKQGAG
ncbi:MAG TPA: tetratricopeptide repeat protein [Rhodanobacteraceae bacterium]|jgi:TolB-like protein/tetratricopeptide (TPR) repeat protein|nr:tetratricopeptide repeat protein [Rhodanobacteraceae bacterium]